MGQTRVVMRDPSQSEFNIELNDTPFAPGQMADPDGEAWKDNTQRIE